MVRKNRHKTIKEIISKMPIEGQEMLLNLLIDKGFELTQATLSRDIKELQIVKAPTPEGRYVYQLTTNVTLQQSGSANSLSAYGFINIEFSSNLAVIKTRPGYAMGIAGEIDRKITREIVGTVAGDDTIMLIIREGISRDEVMDALSPILEVLN